MEIEPAQIVAKEVDLDDPNLEENYPPLGTPETALVVVLDEDRFEIIAHTGRFFHGMLNCAGYGSEEVGLVVEPDLSPGVYVVENCSVSAGEDWCEATGTWRKANVNDLIDFEFIGKADSPFDPAPVKGF